MISDRQRTTRPAAVGVRRRLRPLAAQRKEEHPAMNRDCLFCRITRGRTDTEFLMENETLAVFRDIHPHAPVHLLIVPKKHIRSINDLAAGDGPILADMILAGREMARQTGIAESGYKLFFNVESGGGQVIFHLHLHLMGGWR
ncbi:MAG TPA: HIT domain-containing protein [Desulfobacterales bacterium]|jgi:histidine triad (HIT) family protein|nr:HIT domain-containing protein [Desulfobacterales bacterium]